MSGRYHRLLVHDCPIEVVERLARESRLGATVENVRPVRAANLWFQSRQAIFPDARAGVFQIRNAVFDAALTNEQFIEHLPYWDGEGVFAVFSEKNPIPFRASDLEEPFRYRALDNFGSWLFIALAGPTTDGLSIIASPRADLLDLAETVLGDAS
jgi:hypothetical protein